MQQTAIKLPAIKLVGIIARTNNEAEMDPTQAIISATVQQYFSNGYPDRILQRKNPGMSFCVFTEYASDYMGDYTYLVGEEVEPNAQTPKGMLSITIPTQQYVKFTNGPAAMPDVCINAWQQIWQMTPQDFGGARAYVADFEIYDARATDPQKTVLDIYIGIKK